MKTYDFILIYEHRAREIESMCLLKHELEKRGYSVLVKCYHDMEIFRTKSRVCTPKYHAKVLGVFACYDTYTLRLCVQNCITFDKVINMQWEQMISKSQEQQDSYRNFKEIGKEVVHLSWGEANVERLTKIANLDSKNVLISGNISLDLLREEFRPYYLSRAEINKIYGFEENQKICLLFANFRGAEYDAEQLEILRKKFGDGRVEIQKIGKKTQQKVMEWVVEAAKKFPNYIFIYRPHPGENPKFVREAIEGISNIRIISDYSSRQWIMVSDFLFSWHSTVIVEAYFAGRQCYSLEPYPYLESEDCNVFNDMKAIVDYETFEKVLMGEAFDNNLSITEVERYFGVTEERFNFEKVADAYVKVYQDSSYMLGDKVKEHHLYREEYRDIRERIWGNSIVNYIYWKYMEHCIQNPKLLEKNESAKQYAGIKKHMLAEIVSPEEIQEIESKLVHMLERWKEE